MSVANNIPSLASGAAGPSRHLFTALGANIRSSGVAIVAAQINIA